ncbi:ATP-binding protein [Actinoplanes sp. NPDC026670]|uniref:ATP-binding protein n=1 Tax=Actinoplanes sp. NPDC026670 TaxID=3154700 RepID=UPI0033C5928B
MTETFDPLAAADPDLVAGAIKQRVRNIIRSYNHAADLLAEPIQNAVDEVDEAFREDHSNRGSIVVGIDCSTNKISVRDNGRGITSENVRKLLAPDVTQKAELFRNGRSRGHKGVGLTFLAYGFNFFEIESRTAGEHYRVRVENARQWVEDSSQTVAPRAVIDDLADEEGSLRQPGTVITIQVGGQTEPRDLYRAFPSWDYAETVLEAQSAIGVYPRKAKVEPAGFDARLEYKDRDGVLTVRQLSSSYRFPHTGLVKQVKVIDVGAYLASNPNTEPPVKDRGKYQAAYRFYGTDKLVELLKGRAERVQGDLLTNDADVEEVLRKHTVTAYALAGYAAAYKATLATNWHVPKNRTLVAPSIRVATDSMISSWRRDLSLSHRGFDVERIWLTVHLERVEPDLGRKDWPPQIIELINVLENPLAEDIANQAKPFLIPTTRSGKSIDYDEPIDKAAERRKHPFPFSLPSEMGAIKYVTAPTEEQDVVAIFNELRGMGILKHFEPIFFSGSSYAYDSYLQYDENEVPDFVIERFPVDHAQLNKRTRNGVAEFKFEASELLPDIVREIKDWEHIRWLVCWEANVGTHEQGGQTMHVLELEPGDGMYSGATHAATLESGGKRSVSVIALKTFLERLSAVG